MDTIGQRLRSMRDRKLWTQAELSEQSGVPVITIWRIENEQHSDRPRVSTVRKLAQALRVDAQWLMFGEDIEEGKIAA